MTTELETQLKQALNAFEAAEARGSSRADEYEERIKELSKQIAKEKRGYRPPRHPALHFGPISMTIASMAIVSLGLSILEWPREMRPFFLLFSRMTIVGVICLVSYTSIIYYGCTSALAARPPRQSEAELTLAKMLKARPRPDRPDAWAHTRSHPSAFLTTRHAAPRLFPFPLGKTGADAEAGESVKDELWWEGGNAPHVGHFNKPKIPPPPGPPDEETLVQRVQKSMEIDKQREMWRRRIRDIQYLSCVVIAYFINNKMAILALCVLLYQTIAREIESMLEPPTDMDKSQPKGDLKKRKPGGGMTYIYDPSSANKDALVANASIPIVQVPAHATENSWYAGPGDPVR